jgi:SAM-dependent methyltransferase
VGQFEALPKSGQIRSLEISNNPDLLFRLRLPYTRIKTLSERSAMDRLSSERAFHDHQAHQRAATFTQHPAELRFDEDAYLDHESWIRPALERLSPLAGCSLLDYGCGHGMAAVVLARRGARVTAFDLSPGYLAEAQARARANDVPVTFVQADGERLPFANESFDRVWGNAVLHHLNLLTAARELFRVLRPGGIAVFCEPWGENPLLNWARRHCPYPGKGRTPDEHPLQRRHLRVLHQVFPHVETQGFQLLSMVGRVLPERCLLAPLQSADTWLLTRWPAVQVFCRYFVLTLRRDGYNEKVLDVP